MLDNNHYNTIIIGAGPAGLTVVHQFDKFQAYEHAIEEARSNSKVNFILDSTITAFHGNESITSVDIKNLKSGESHEFKTDGAYSI